MGIYKYDQSYRKSISDMDSANRQHKNVQVQTNYTGHGSPSAVIHKDQQQAASPHGHLVRFALLVVKAQGP